MLSMSMGCNLIFGVEEGLPRETAEAPGPELFVSAPELRAVRAAAADGRAPWVAAHARYDLDLDLARVLPLSSVVDDGGPVDGEVSAFGTDRATGDCDPGALLDARHDYCAALVTGRAARDLAIAWVMDGNVADAARAVDLLHHWFVAPDTRMAPIAANSGPKTDGESGGTDIEVHLAVPLLLYAASLVEGHPTWERHPGGREALRAWVEDFEVDLGRRAVAPAGTPQYGYYLVALAACHAYLRRPDDLLRDFDRWRDLVEMTVDDEGNVDVGTTAQDVWFFLKSVFLMAQLGTYNRADLYGDPRLQAALARYGACVTDPDGCVLGTAPSANELREGAVLYELGYSQYQAPLFLDVLEAAGRPIEGQRIFGWVTLTHGEQFELD